MSDRIKVAEYHAIYTNFWKLFFLIYIYPPPQYIIPSIWLQPRNVRLGWGWGWGWGLGVGDWDWG